jgi:acetylornithine deacetylase
MADSTIKLLRDLIAIDSVNPSLVPGGAGESEIATAVAQTMRTAGMDVEIEEAEPGRPNVVGVLEGREPGPTLMFCGHTDTVSVDGMSQPFDPVERDGRIYGRGSGDMKGGVAAMLEAAVSLARSGGLKAGRLIVAAVADEEYASIGAEALVKNWRADAAVVTEPTDLKVGVGHKGFSWVEVVTEGRAAHGSRPAEGRDAILRMGRVLSRLEALNQQLGSRPPHQVLGHPSLHASLIDGGRELSTYPDRCVLRLERRTIEGEPENTALDEVNEILKVLIEEDSEFKASASLMFNRRAYVTPADHNLPSLMEEAVRHTGHETTREGMTYWADTAVLGHTGIPSIIFGPGGDGFHALEEYVRTEEVLICRDALIELAGRYCSNH